MDFLQAVDCAEPPGVVVYALCFRREEPPGGIMLLRTSSRMYGSALILDCNGKIIFGQETAELRQRVMELLAQTRHVVLNLSNVSYIDSAGVGELIRLLTTAAREQKTIALAGLTGRVRDVLQITKLATVFATYATPAEAAEALSARAAAS